MLFANREAAGRLLADRLVHLKDEQGLVLAIPRGGAVTAKVVAERLGWPLSVVIVKKIGAPGQSELAVGAMAEDGEIVWEEAVLASLGLLGSLKERKQRLKREIERAREKVKEYKGRFATRSGKWEMGKCLPARPSACLPAGRARRAGKAGEKREGRQKRRGRVTIVVDDGVATGSTALAALRFVRRCGVKKVILATPVIAADTLDKLKTEADELVYLQAPRFFAAVGQFYRDFEQVEDEEVIKIISNDEMSNVKCQNQMLNVKSKY